MLLFCITEWEIKHEATSITCQTQNKPQGGRGTILFQSKRDGAVKNCKQVAYAHIVWVVL